MRTRACIAMVATTVLASLGLVVSRPIGAAASSLSSWTQLDNPLHPSSRAYVAAAYDPDIHATVIFGGSSYSSGGLIDETWLRHDDGGWTELAGAQPGPRQLALMAYDPSSHQVILFGGAGPAPPGSPILTRLGDTWAFDGTGWTQLQPAVSPSPRFLAAMTYSNALGEIVLFGGNDPSGPDNDTWTWHAGSWHHVVTATAPSPRESPQLSDDPSTGTLLLYGGAPVAPFTPYTDTWSFDGANWTQLQPAHNPGGISDGFMSADPAQHDVVLFGGWGQNALSTDTWLWSGADWSKATTTLAPFARSDGGAVYDSASQEVLVVCGDNAGNADFHDVWGWDGAAWHDRSVPIEPYQRFEGMMGFDPVSQRSIVFGGIGPDGTDLADTWAFDGSTWSQVAGSTPPPRRDAAFAFTPQGTGLLFGGFHNGNQLSDTWSWTAAGGWHQLQPLLSPPARQGSRLAWDPAIGSLVLFGGQGLAALGDTWTWTGTSWSPVATAVVPQGRGYPSLAYDSVSGRLLMFGGFAGSTDFADTWAFDGTLWTQLSPAHSPSGRWGAAFGAAGGQLVLFGGTTDTGANGETWTWNGSDWNELTTASSPEARQSPLAAADTARGEFIVFGGFARIREQDTWAFGAAAPVSTPELSSPALTAVAIAVAAAMLRRRAATAWRRRREERPGAR